MDACTFRGSERRAEGGLGPDPGIRRLLGARCQQEDLRARPSLMRLLAACNEAFCSCPGACRQFWQGQSGTRSRRIRQLRPGPCPQAPETWHDICTQTLCVKEALCRAKKLNAELANGRLAMMAIIGMSLAPVQGSSLCPVRLRRCSAAWQYLRDAGHKSSAHLR